VPPFLKEYQLLAELAQGGMGSIYLGRRRDEGRAGPCLAIKVLHDRMHDDPSARFMMLDEAHSAARVRHPNVTSVVDVGSYEGGCYLVMEYVEGCSLQQLLQANPEARPPQLLIPIVIDMLEGLHAAHKSRDPSGEPYEIVHRDATPHNVLVGVNGAAKITDFGIAQSKDRYTVTDVGLHKGKASFMAPEQIRGERVDAKVDVWAAGVTLFSALTGMLPFGEGLSVATLENILRGEVPTPSRVGLRPPACLDWLVLCALQRDGAARFHDARAFADALRSVAKRHKLLGTPAQVAAWVRSSWGAKLRELDRQVAAGRDLGLMPRRGLPPSLPPMLRLSPLAAGPGERAWEDVTTVRNAPLQRMLPPPELRRHSALRIPPLPPTYERKR
jgi:serine/threonine protein kinase